MEELEQLSFLLQEEKFPYFDVFGLEMLLTLNKNDILKAAYQGCLLKSNADESIKVGSIEIKGGDREYWLALAEDYNKQITIRDKVNSSGYKSRMKRSDGQ